VATPNIVLVGQHSRDAQRKRDSYARAARGLGLAVRLRPDKATIGILPCSDFSALIAARLCRRWGVPGPEPLAVQVALTKSLAYEFLSARGFRTLPWFIPMEKRDLGWPFRGPVIVKPEQGSGSYSPHPWGYRRFESLAAFRRFLGRNRLTEAFFAWQSMPGPGIGRYIVMQYSPGPMHAVMAVTGSGRPILFDTHTLRPLGDNLVIDWQIHGVRHRDTAQAVAMVERLAEFGLRHSVIYLQCVERGGHLYPIDVNLRPATSWGTLIDALGLPAFEGLLACMLDLRKSLKIAWPAPYVGFRRLKLPLRPGRFRIRFGAGAIPLISEFRYDPRSPDDRVCAYPSFGVLLDDPREFDSRARAVISASRVEGRGKARALRLALR
jgi:hypothetical protein